MNLLWLRFGEGCGERNPALPDDIINDICEARAGVNEPTAGEYDAYI